jgi:hypothetical protein
LLIWYLTQNCENPKLKNKKHFNNYLVSAFYLPPPFEDALTRPKTDSQGAEALLLLLLLYRAE